MRFYSPPIIRSKPVGVSIALSDLCRQAGMRCRVSADRALDVRLHFGGQHVLAATKPGQRSFCVGISGFSEDLAIRALQILECLAYSFHDWHAREILRQDKSVRRAKDKRRLASSGEDAIPHGHHLSLQPSDLRSALSPTNLGLLAVVLAHPDATVADIARISETASPNVSRSLRILERAGLVTCRRIGRVTRSCATPCAESLLQPS
jgi:predicted transcriptional regulator